MRKEGLRYLSLQFVYSLTVSAGERHPAVSFNVVFLSHGLLEGLRHLLGLELTAQLKMIQ